MTLALLLTMLNYLISILNLTLINSKEFIMSIIRVSKNKKNPYFLMNKTGIDDKRLSLKSKGLLAYLISKPDSWYINYHDLVSSSLNGIKSIRSAVQELLITGYIVRTPIRKDNGRFTYYDYTVYEKPQKPNYNKNKLAPYSRKRHAVKRHADNHTLLNNEKKLYNDQNNITFTEKSNVNNVVMNDINLEKLKHETKLLLYQLGIKDFQKLFDSFPVSDIFIYADWMLSKNTFFSNPAGFLFSALKEKWTDPELQKNLIV